MSLNPFINATQPLTEKFSSSTGEVCIYYPSNQSIKGEIKRCTIEKQLPEYLRSQEIIDVLEDVLLLQHSILPFIIETKVSQDQSSLSFNLPAGNMFEKWLTLDDSHRNKFQIYRILSKLIRYLSQLKELGINHGRVEYSSLYITDDEEIYLLDSAIITTTYDLLSSQLLDNVLIKSDCIVSSPAVSTGQTPEEQDDIYNLIIFAYQLLTDHHPFNGKSSIDLDVENRLLNPLIHPLNNKQLKSIKAGLALGKKPLHDIKYYYRILFLNNKAYKENKLLPIPNQVSQRRRQHLVKKKTELKWLLKLIAITTGIILGNVIMHLFFA